MTKRTADSVERLAAGAVAVAGATNAIAGIVAAFLKEGLGQFVQTKVQEAEDLLIDQIRHADAWDRLMEDPEGLAARTIRYIRASTVGAAHDNLRLLARLVVYGDGSRAIVADDFLYLAQTLESLRHDEMVVLATFIKLKNSSAYATEEERANSVLPTLRKIFDEDEAWSLLSGLQRTGLIFVTTGWGGGGWNAAPLLQKLEDSIQFADAVARARAARAS